MSAPPVPSGRRVIVFTRYPEAGKTKTRLIPVLGAGPAAELQRRMTARALRHAEEAAGPGDVLEIRYAGGDADLMRRAFGERRYRGQGGGDLGRRMLRSLEEAFSQGSDRVVVIGTDCPDLDGPLVREAFDLLAENDAVIGPAEDGGYYLIGLSRPVPELFDRLPWGTGRVLRRTLAVASGLGLRVAMLRRLQDVDRPADLEVCDRTMRDEGAVQLSIIIPTLNERDNVRELLSGGLGRDADVIVADGGSADGTPELAESLGAKVVRTGRGRARQCNGGAAAAGGRHLLFLHADTRLPGGFRTIVSAVLSDRTVAAGAFLLKIDSPAPGLRIIEALADFRSRAMGMPYGDQALFLRAETFRDVGGFPDLPIMDDFELVRRLRGRGRVLTLPVPVRTSARRWERLGVLRTTIRNQGMILGYLLGVPPERLARWYRSPPTGKLVSYPRP